MKSALLCSRFELLLRWIMVEWTPQFSHSPTQCLCADPNCSGVYHAVLGSMHTGGVLSRYLTACFTLNSCRNIHRWPWLTAAVGDKTARIVKLLETDCAGASWLWITCVRCTEGHLVAVISGSWHVLLTVHSPTHSNRNYTGTPFPSIQSKWHQSVSMVNCSGNTWNLTVG